MTQLELATDLTEWFAETTFCAALLLAALYGIMFNWRETVTGRAVFILTCSIAGALLHTVLIIWGVTTVHLTRTGTMSTGGLSDETLTWISVISLGTAALAIILLCWQVPRYILAESQNPLIRKLFRLTPRLCRGITADETIEILSHPRLEYLIVPVENLHPDFLHQTRGFSPKPRPSG